MNIQPRKSQEERNRRWEKSRSSIVRLIFMIVCSLLARSFTSGGPGQAARRRSFGIRDFTFDAAEYHSPSRGLQHAGDRDSYFLADGSPTLFHDDHGAIVEIANPLADLIARLDQPDIEDLAGQSHRFEGVGHLIQVDDLNALQLGNLV